MAGGRESWGQALLLERRRCDLRDQLQTIAGSSPEILGALWLRAKQIGEDMDRATRDCAAGNFTRALCNYDAFTPQELDLLRNFLLWMKHVLEQKGLPTPPPRLCQTLAHDHATFQVLTSGEDPEGGLFSFVERTLLRFREVRRRFRERSTDTVPQDVAGSPPAKRTRRVAPPAVASAESMQEEAWWESALDPFMEASVRTVLRLFEEERKMHPVFESSMHECEPIDAQELLLSPIPSAPRRLLFSWCESLDEAVSAGGETRNRGGKAC